MMRLKPEKWNSQHGFGVIVAVLILLALGIATVSYLGVQVAQDKNERIEESRERVQNISDALVEYQTRTGFYPCPARLTDKPGDPTFGVASSDAPATPTNCATQAANPPGGVTDSGGVRFGMLPFRTLGLPQESALDPWGNKLSYAVTRSLTNASTFGAGTGSLSIVDASGASLITPPGSAQFVVLSHGMDGGGATPLKSSQLKAPCIPTGTQPHADAENCDTNSTFKGLPVKMYENVPAVEYTDDLLNGSWVATAGDYDPDLFSFADQDGVAVSTVITSNSVTLTGFNRTVNAVGSAGITVSINGGAFASVVGGVKVGDQIRIRLTSAPTPSTPRTGTVTVGGTTSGIWTVTTAAPLCVVGCNNGTPACAGQPPCCLPACGGCRNLTLACLGCPVCGPACLAGCDDGTPACSGFPPCAPICIAGCDDGSPACVGFPSCSTPCPTSCSDPALETMPATCACPAAGCTGSTRCPPPPACPASCAGCQDGTPTCAPCASCSPSCPASCGGIDNGTAACAGCAQKCYSSCGGVDNGTPNCADCPLQCHSSCSCATPGQPQCADCAPCPSACAPECGTCLTIGETRPQCQGCAHCPGVCPCDTPTSTGCYFGSTANCTTPPGRQCDTACHWQCNPFVPPPPTGPSCECHYTCSGP